MGRQHIYGGQVQPTVGHGMEEDREPPRGARRLNALARGVLRHPERAQAVREHRRIARRPVQSACFHLGEMGEEVYATPAIADGHIWVRTATALYDFAD